MAKRKKKMPGYGRLLDAWVPPDGAGDPIGCIATTFTFNAAFYEEECLASFLGLESDSADGPVYLIEREEKLSRLSCAAVLVDSHHCCGARSLRWDLLPARLPGIQHSKISLLVWSGWVRLIIGSANLTEDAYRRNLEVFGVLDYFEGSESPFECLRDTISFLRRAAEFSLPSLAEVSPARGRWNELLERVVSECLTWGKTQDDKKRSVRVSTVFVGPTGRSCIDQLQQLWPSSTPALEADVVSPFFNAPESPNAPAKEIWKLLRKRGEVSVGYHVTGEEVPQAANDDSATGRKDTYLHAPESLVKNNPRDATHVSMYRVEAESRPLHAKGIWLHDDRWTLYQIGSSNFTTAGLGLGNRRNLEANLVYIVDGKRSGKIGHAIEAAFPKSDFVEIENVLWQPLPAEDDSDELDTLSLPSFFGEAIYSTDESSGTVQLTFTEDSGPAFKLTTEGSHEVWFDSQQWHELGKPQKCFLDWEHPRPPSGFEVHVDTKSSTAWWPVNVQSGESLPPPQELRGLSLEVLIELLSSARPLHRVMAAYLRNESLENNDESVSVVDPHKRVDTTGFVLQRTRRLSWALAAMRERVEQPASTKETLHWRLRGPVGVTALADAIAREAKSDEESTFLLAELALELGRAKPQQAPGCIHLDDHLKEIQGVIEDLKQRVSTYGDSGPENLRQYVSSVLTAVTS